MNPKLRNVLSVLAGVIVGGIVNLGIILLSDGIVQFPEGVDVSSAESMKENMHLFEPVHFVFPFLAHAVGTLIGAYTAVRFSTDGSLNWALIVGGFFLIGGVMAVYQIGGPLWFKVLDLVGAYIPMAYLGHGLVQKN